MCHELPEPYTTKSTDTNIPIQFDPDWEVGLGGGLWSTGKAMSNYFQDQAPQIRSDLSRLLTRKYGDNKLLAIELGSGNGFLSCIFAYYFASLIHLLVVTDLQDHVPLIRKTLENNSSWVELVLDEGDISTTRPDIPVKTMVLEYAWGQQNPLPGHKFDFIFGTDIAYRHYLHEALIQSLQELSHSDTIILIGITMMDTDVQFFHKLQEAGFTYDRLADHLMNQEFRGSSFGLFVIRWRNDVYY